jgi:acylpyruvate hydrolase
MRLVTYQLEEKVRLGVLLGEQQVVDLKAAHQAMDDQAEVTFLEDMIALLAAGPTGLEKVAVVLAFAATTPANFVHPLEQVTLLPPVLKPGMVIALGRNYAAHAAEGGATPPDYPMLFHKTAGSLLGAGGTNIIPPITNKVDYEGELAVVIGRTCKQVAPQEALDYVAGYTIANDVSARDLQRRTSQFTAGKMLDTFGPLGPALVTRDEIPDPGNLAIRTRLNGQVMQDDTTRNMIFDVPFTISYISHIATLNIGDVILTGTPEGVGYPRNPPVFLQEGDVISVEFEGLGTLTNDVKKQDATIS